MASLTSQLDLKQSIQRIYGNVNRYAVLWSNIMEDDCTSLIDIHGVYLTRKVSCSAYTPSSVDNNLDRGDVPRMVPR